VKLIVAADEDRPVVAFIAEHLRKKGHDVRVLPATAWARVAVDAASAVSRGEADQAVICCWTGTGVTIAANKVSGIRAALCVDAQTASGARKWNDANVLTLSLRLLSEPVATEIVDAWLAEKYAGTEDESLGVISREEREGV
jgi:ribose 5-phosphate isomerase B